MKTVRNFRWVALLLAMMMICSAFVMSACADQTEQSEDPAQTDDPTTPDEPVEEEEPEVLPDVPEGNYDYELNVMHWQVIGLENVWTIWEEVCPDEEITSHTGDLITDDIYDRTAWLADN